MTEPRAKYAHKIRLLDNAVTRIARQETATMVALEPRVLLSSVSIGNVAITEPANGIAAANFPLTLDQASTTPVTVNYKTRNGSAKAGTDFVKTKGSITFAPGQTSQTIDISIIGGVAGNLQKQFSVALTKSPGVTIANRTGTGTIQDNITPALSVESTAVVLTKSGTQKVALAVLLSGKNSSPVEAHWATADGTAVAGQDYKAAGGSIRFRPGQVSRVLHLSIINNSAPANDRNFFVNLSNPNEAVVGENGTVTIIGANGVNQIFIDNASIAEGNSGFQDMNFNVHLLRPSDGTVSVDYQTASGPNSVGQYVSVSGTLQFLSGQQTSTISVPVVGDTFYEPNQIFYVQLSDPNGAALANTQATGTIKDDDPLPTTPPPIATVNSISLPEGNSGTTPFVFTVSLSTPSPVPVTVFYSTRDQSAVDGKDYTGGNGAVYFAPGVTSQSVTVQVIGNTIAEPDKTFELVLDGADYANYSNMPGVGTILNDDFPAMSINNVHVAEGNSGTTPAMFTVTLAQPSNELVTVNYATADGTATVADNDYQATSGTLSFLPGQTSQTITVLVNGDTTPENDETFFVNLSNPSNAILTNSQATGTITNDDSAPSSVVMWTGNAGDLLWSDPANWSDNAVPGAGDDVVINKTETSPIVYDTIDTDVHSVFSNSPINLNGGVLTVDSTIQVSNTFELQGGTLENASILPGSGGQGLLLSSTGGTLVNVISEANIDGTAAGATAQVVGNLQLDGSLNLTSSENPATIYFVAGEQGGVNITGTAQIDFGQASDRLVNSGSGGADPLTIGSGVILTGIGGEIASDGGPIINNGTIKLSGTFQIGDDFTNYGQLFPGGSGGIGDITITGNFTQTAGGTINVDIAGNSGSFQYDSVNVSGSATLDGQLNSTLIDNYQPSSGSSFQLLNYQSVSGTFAHVVVTNPPTGVTFDSEYGANAFSLRAQNSTTNVYYVDSGADAGSPDGRSWSTAFPDLQSALSVATSGNIIEIAGGTYYPTAGSDPNVSFVLPEGVEIIGGFAGSALPDSPDAHDVDLYPTTLSGDIGEQGVNSDNSHHVVDASNSGVGSALYGLTITDGNANGTGDQANGAGLYMASGALLIANCTFTENSADALGGAVYATSDASIQFSDSKFTDNSASSGGAVYGDGASMGVENSSFTSNSATSQQGYGGAISNNDDGTLLITGCSFYANSATIAGGAIENDDGATSTISNTIFVGNSATGSSYGDGSTAGYGGAIDAAESASVIIANCTFTRNSATNPNGPGTYGDALSSNNSQIYIYNSILWGDSTGYGSEIFSSDGSSLTISNSDVRFDGGTNLINADPEFVRNPSPGLDGVWGTADDDLGDLALQPTSPAIDTGDNSLMPSEATTDIAGHPRIVDASNTADSENGIVDMGAYEFSPVYVDINAEGAGTGASWADAYTSLAQAIDAAESGQTIVVAGGVYTPTDTGDRTVSFQLQSGVAIFGGFAGSASGNPNTRDLLDFTSVLSGDIGTISDSSDNSFHVVQANGTDLSAVLDGFTIQNGNADNSATGDISGAGLLDIDADPFINNCIFTDNSAQTGAAVFVAGTSARFDNCQFIDNAATDIGGAVAITSDTQNFNNCLFQNNSATNSGGAIYGGGGVINLLDCSMQGNTASSGGAIYSALATGSIINSIFSLNSADQGGAIYTASSSPMWSVLNSTFAGNSAGGGGALYLSSSHAMQIQNSILSGDSADSWSEIYYSGAGSAVISFSDVNQEIAGTNNIDQDPNFVRDPQTNSESDYGILSLRAGSPAIDSGDTSAIPAGLTTDLAGNARISGGGVDMGAYEFDLT